MKALFCHDHVFVCDGAGKVYSSGQFSAAIWQRYLEVFDALTVVGRCRRLGEGEPTAGLDLASRPGVSFVFLPDLASIAGQTWRRSEAKRILAQAVEGVDAVIARLPSEIGLLAAKLARALGKLAVVEVVGCPWDGLWNYGGWEAKAYAPVRAWRMRREVAKARYAVYVTREFLQRRYPSDGYVAAVSDVEIGPSDPTVLARRMQRIEDFSQPLVFGLIGSIGNEIKGIRTALEALARIRDALPPFEFRVLGLGDPQPWRDLAAHHRLTDVLHFCDVLPSGPPVLAWLDDIDIYLQPSFKEGLPRATIEAMSRGCPALGSTAGGIPELLSAECLHRPGDSEKLGELMLSAAINQAFRVAQARRNFEVAGQYATDVLAARRKAFWRRFASEAMQRPGRGTEPPQ